MKLVDIKRDRKRSEGGVWWNFEAGSRVDKPHEKDFCVLVAEAHNPRYRDALARIRLERHGELRSAGDKALEVLQSMTDQATADAVLLDWCNLHDEDGEVIPYSREKALELLQDRDLWQFRHFILDVSGVGQAYRHEVEKDALGN